MISIVDDDFSVRESTKELVESLGYEALTFASAEEFLESQRLSDTSCLITDLQMSGLSGIDLQRRLVDEDRQCVSAQGWHRLQHRSPGATYPGPRWPMQNRASSAKG